ncbi:hypothetical protein D3C73_1627250 [compost metagenome]
MVITWVSRRSDTLVREMSCSAVRFRSGYLCTTFSMMAGVLIISLYVLIRARFTPMRP